MQVLPLIVALALAGALVVMGNRASHGELRGINIFGKRPDELSDPQAVNRIVAQMFHALAGVIVLTGVAGVYWPKSEFERVAPLLTVPLIAVVLTMVVRVWRHRFPRKGRR